MRPSRKRFSRTNPLEAKHLLADSFSLASLPAKPGPILRGVFMRRNVLWRLALALVLAGCGGRPVGFVNETRHSDAELWRVWKAAQETLAQEVDLNPLQRSSTGAPADIRSGDPRALTVVPHQLHIGPAPDVSSRELLAATGLDRDNPTGMIACPKPYNVRYAAAYSVYNRGLTQYAASWEDQGDSFTFVLEYEFENQILAALGYSLKWR
jgi:hypothetical protein